MAASAAGPAWSKECLALLAARERKRAHSSSARHHWGEEILGKYFNAHLISAGREVWIFWGGIFYYVITWVVVTVSMDVSALLLISSSLKDFRTIILSRGTVVLVSSLRFGKS